MSETQTPASRPYPEDRGRTHYPGCWRDRGHHGCAVAEVERFTSLGARRCACDVAMGSYENQVVLTMPDGRTVGIDACIAAEVQSLWEEGIRTVASCCGHNLVPGVLSVAPEHHERMRGLGYQPAENHPDAFAPRYRRLSAPAPRCAVPAPPAAPALRELVEAGERAIALLYPYAHPPECTPAACRCGFTAAREAFAGGRRALATLTPEEPHG